MRRSPFSLLLRDFAIKLVYLFVARPKATQEVVGLVIARLCKWVAQPFNE